jgi:hypothetical protein
MLVVDGRGLPLGVLVESAQKGEVKLAEATLSGVRVPKRGPGRPRTRPREAVADRGYDGEALRPRLRARGIAPRIPWRKERPGPARVEAGPVGLPAEVGGGADLRLAGELSEAGGEMGKKGPDLPGLPPVDLLPYPTEDYFGMSCSLTDKQVRKWGAFGAWAPAVVLGFWVEHNPISDRRGPLLSRIHIMRLRLHQRIHNIRRDGRLRRLTTWLAKTKPAILVQDLSVRGLIGGWQSRSVADASCGTFRRMRRRRRQSS